MEEKILIKSEAYDIKKAFVIISSIGAIISAILVLINLADTLFDWTGCFFPFCSLTLISGVIYLWLHSYELTVTDKRIYGKTGWGIRVDLPIDSISATATIRIVKGVSVSTSSGRIRFLIIKNSDSIYTTISNLLIERQQEKAKPFVATTTPKADETEQLKKYKELLDAGVITQEEFDAKKKQLLGL